MKKILILMMMVVCSSSLFAAKSVPMPLYTDPVFAGSADPEVVWNSHEQEWWIFYTSRRAVCEGAPLPALAIGVASSKDWMEWKHRGYIGIDGVEGKAMGADILWAPGIVKDGDTYHMFLTYKKGNGRGGRWGIPQSTILHLKAPASDLLNGWQTYGLLEVPFNSIDATIVKHKGVWNIFHRDIIKNQKGVNTFRITTKSLDSSTAKWNYLGACKGDVNDRKLTGYGYQEGQFAFYWKGYYWMLTDNTSRGVPVYRSDDLEEWKFMEEILMVDGKHPSQKGNVRHPGVVVLGDRAFVFYFCQPYYDKKASKSGKAVPANSETCYVQVSELKFENGSLTADRDQKVVPPASLVPTVDHWGFIGEE